MTSNWTLALLAISISFWIYLAYKADRGVLSRFSGIALLFSAVAFPFAVDTFIFERAVADHGAVSTVFPISSYEEKDGTWGKSYLAVIQFKTLSGEVVSTKRGIPDVIVAKIKARQPFEVSYLPENPEHIWFRETGSDALNIFLIGILSLGVGLGLLFIKRTIQRRAT